MFIRNLFRKISSIFIVYLISIPTLVFAHVKWFIETDSVSPVKAYGFFDLPVLMWIVVSAFIIAVGVFLEKRLPESSKRFKSFLNFLEPLVIPLFRILIGIGFVAFSLQDYIFAPSYVSTSQFTTIMSIMQMAIGSALIFGIFTKILAALLFVLFAMFSVNFGLLATLEAFGFFGIAFVLLFGTSSYFSLFRSRTIEAICDVYNQYAIPVLRMSVGVNLIVLGFTEKILHPEFGVEFLRSYDFNFMQALGFAQYSDYWFVLSAGVVEILFGIIFMLGVVTRLNALVVSLFFITTLILLGPAELIGHLPHFAIVMMLLVFGSGKKLKIN